MHIQELINHCVTIIAQCRIFLKIILFLLSTVNNLINICSLNQRQTYTVFFLCDYIYIYMIKTVYQLRILGPFSTNKKKKSYPNLWKEKNVVFFFFYAPSLHH